MKLKNNYSILNENNINDYDKLQKRIELLSQELETQQNINKQQIDFLHKKYEYENEENLHKEIANLVSSQEKIYRKSTELLEENEEKMNYYLILSVKLKQQLDCIEDKYLKELAKVQESNSLQIKKSLETMEEHYEEIIKKMHREKEKALEQQHEYINELEEFIKELLKENNLNKKLKENLLEENKKIERELNEIYEQNLKYQGSIKEISDFHAERICKMKEEYSNEKNSLTFQLKTLKKNLVFFFLPTNKFLFVSLQIMKNSKIHRYLIRKTILLTLKKKKQ